LKLALIGYGNVGRALERLIASRRREFPFTITGIHTLRHGTAVDPNGLGSEPEFGPRAGSIEEFLDAAAAEVAVELTTLDPTSGEPAISHIRAAFARGMHVVTANKGPIAHAYAD
jgi:homoserine dehydrogenase